MTLLLNQKAPLFTLPNQDGEKISLKDLQPHWIVLYFYPKDNTPGCTLEALDFTSLQEEFGKYNALIVGVSPDSPQSHCSFIKKQNLTLLLLSDPEKKVLRKYGVWGKKKFMGREYQGVLRTTFLINPKGNIASVWKNVNVKGHAQAVLATLKELV